MVAGRSIQTGIVCPQLFAPGFNRSRQMQGIRGFQTVACAKFGGATEYATRTTNNGQIRCTKEKLELFQPSRVGMAQGIDQTFKTGKV